MKNIFLIISTLFYFLGCSPVFAALSDSDKAQVDAKNKLANPGFENGKSGWTSSGGTFGLTSSSITGKTSATWDSSAASQTFSGTPVTITSGFAGTNALAYCSVRVPTGTATHKLQVYDGTNVVAERNITSSSATKQNEINFIFPASGTVRPRLISVAADEPSIEIDDCYVGPASNISQVSQAVYLGSLTYAPASNCRWQANNGSFADYPADTDCSVPTVTGQLQALATKKPGFRLPSIGPGILQIKAIGNFRKDSADTGNWPLFRFSDGTNFSASQGVGATITGTASTSPIIEGTITYTSAQTNLDINVQSTSTSGAVSSEIYDEAVGELKFEAYYFPSDQQSIVGVSQTQSIYSGDIAFAAGTSNATVFADINMTTPSLGTTFINQNNGSVAVYASGLGITITPKQLGVYEACFDVSFTHNTSAQNNSFVIYNGLTAIGSPVTAQVNSGTDIKTVKPCGQFTATAIAPVDIHVMYATSAGTMTLVSAGVTLKSISSAVNAPVLVGSITQESGGADKIIYANSSTPCTTGTCALLVNNGFSSIIWNAAGNYIATFSKPFSNNPVCTCSSGGVGACVVTPSVTTPTSVNFATYPTGGGGSSDQDFQIQCVGPK